MSDYLYKELPKLGFGLMRLPTIPGGSQKDIDFDQVTKMVDMFMERGFSYFDTAYIYHEGASESVIKKCLVGKYPREKFQVVDKMPMWNITGFDSYERIFQDQLSKTGLEYFDIYFLHGIGVNNFETIDRTEGWKFLKSLKERGLAKHIGFSYHSPAEPLDKLLGEHPEIEVVQLQLNYLDWESEQVQSRKCWEACRKHGVAVTVMEPIKGGSLANPHPTVQKVFKELEPDSSAASWALRFAASHDGIITVLSGMSNIDQVDDNTKSMANFKPFGEKEFAAVEKAVKAFNEIPIIPCTSCRYCTNDCPQRINIPAIIGMVNEYIKYQSTSSVGFGYMMAIGQGGRASSCVECHSCEEHCPQHIKITEHLKKAAELFEKNLPGRPGR